MTGLGKGMLAVGILGGATLAVYGATRSGARRRDAQDALGAARVPAATRDWIRTQALRVIDEAYLASGAPGWREPCLTVARIADDLRELRMPPDFEFRRPHRQVSLVRSALESLRRQGRIGSSTGTGRSGREARCYEPAHGGDSSGLGRPKIKMKCAPFLSPEEMKELEDLLSPDEMKECRFRQVRPFRAARFVRKKDKREFAIVHPSTKYKGKCQVSYFDQDGPYSDTQYKNCTAALKDLRPRQWKLVEVK